MKKAALITLLALFSMAGYSQDWISDQEVMSSVRAKFNALKLAFDSVQAGLLDTIEFASGHQLYEVDIVTDTAYLNNDTVYTASYFKFGEMYQWHEGVTTDIDESGVDNLIGNFTSTNLRGWTFDAGSTGKVTHVGNNGGDTIRVTCVSHGLSDEAIISIRGTTSYNGVFEIDSINADTFDIVTTYVADESGNWDEGSHLIAGTTAGGLYYISLTITMNSEADSTGYQFKVYKETTALTNVWIEHYCVTAEDENCSTAGIVSITAGDRIYISVQNEDDASDVLIYAANLTLFKL